MSATTSKKWKWSGRYLYSTVKLLFIMNDSRPENDRARQKRYTSPCLSSHLLPTPTYTCLLSSCDCFPTTSAESAANSRGLLSVSVTIQMALVEHYIDSAFFFFFSLYMQKLILIFASSSNLCWTYTIGTALPRGSGFSRNLAEDKKPTADQGTIKEKAVLERQKTG